MQIDFTFCIIQQQFFIHQWRQKRLEQASFIRCPSLSSSALEPWNVSTAPHSLTDYRSDWFLKIIIVLLRLFLLARLRNTQAEYLPKYSYPAKPVINKSVPILSGCWLRSFHVEAVGSCCRTLSLGRMGAKSARASSRACSNEWPESFLSIGF